MKRLVLGIVFEVFAVSMCSGTPVIAWTADRSCCDDVEISSLKTFNSYDFELLLSNMIEKKKRIIIFVEDFLAIEDFISNKLNSQEIFYHLQDIGRTKTMLYFPNVADPLNSFEYFSRMYSIYEYNTSENINYTQCENTIPEIKSGKADIIKIYLGRRNDNESRGESLQYHDQLMSTICNCAGRYNKEFCVYTGSKTIPRPTILQEEDLTPQLRRIRSKYAYDDSYEMNSLLSEYELGPKQQHCEKNCVYKIADEDSSVLFYVADPPKLTLGDTTYEIKNFQSSLKTVNDSFVRLKFETNENSLLFNFAKKSPKWELENVLLEAESKEIPLSSDIKVEAGHGRSFFCKRAVFQSEDAKLSLGRLQVEPSFRGTNDSGVKNKTVFSGEYDECVPFQSIAVFMAWLVGSTLLLIVAWAVGMLQAIGSNNSFDGPAQKILLRE